MFLMWNQLIFTPFFSPKQKVQKSPSYLPCFEARFPLYVRFLTQATLTSETPKTEGLATPLSKYRPTDPVAQAPCPRVVQVSNATFIIYFINFSSKPAQNVAATPILGQKGPHFPMFLM